MVRVSGWSAPSTRSIVGQGLLKQGDRLGRAARPPVGEGEVSARGQGVGVVGAQHPLQVGQVLLMQGDRLGRPARRPVGVGKVIARSQGVRVVGAQHPLQVGQGLLIQGDRLGRPARRPGRRWRGYCA